MRPRALPVVLVVEDEEPIRRLITETLRQDGYELVDVGSGDEALAELRRDGASFALVLLDIVMPGMSGEALMREMRQDPRLRDLPVLVVTALASLADASRMIEAGADAYLAKPFRIQELREVAAGLIRTHLRGDATSPATE
jgi:CheY-like chemotaxis protein